MLWKSLLGASPSDKESLTAPLKTPSFWQLFALVLDEILPKCFPRLWISMLEFAARWPKPPLKLVYEVSSAGTASPAAGNSCDNQEK